jgi:4-alpha-glucanotransferase
MMNIQDKITSSISSSHWQKIGIFPHHGISLPLFSLHSKNSVGTGEFLDLIPVIDWCSKVGFDILQLLPLNERDEEASPYTTISSLALDPTYISLFQLPYLQKNPSLYSLVEECKEFSLTQHPLHQNTPNQQKEKARVDYPAVKKFKEDWLRRYFSRIKRLLIKEKAFEKFLQKNTWLVTYALFKIFRKKYNNLSWELWPKEFSSPPSSSFSPSLPPSYPWTEEQNWLEEQKQQHKEEILFFSALQFFCFDQMKKVKHHADQKKVFLLGDFPLFISKESVDVWQSPEYFNFNWVAGAPPDNFYPLGQKWGFPIFQWDIMKKDHYFWWKRRFTLAEELYHLYRIDHVVGLFRIWAISQEGEAISGHFIPEDPETWGLAGEEHLLAFLKNSPLLPIAEDLGTIPQVTYDVLKKMGICGIKILVEQEEALELQNYDPLSITTLSTHDTEPLALWWQNHQDKAKKLSDAKGFTFSPILSIAVRKKLLFDSHHTTSLFHCNLLQEYLALRPTWVSSDPADERINSPGVISEKNWSYRIRPSIEEWTNDKSFREEVKSITR